VITEANFGVGSYYQVFGGVAGASKGKHIPLTKSAWSNRDGYICNGFIYLKTNQEPTISSVSGWADSNGITGTCWAEDPDSSKITQIDAWLNDHSTGAKVARSHKYLQNVSAQNFRFNWAASELFLNLTKSGNYSVGFRVTDDRGAVIESRSTSFYYTKPTPSAPEMDVFLGSTAINNNGAAPLIRCKVNSSAVQYLTVKNTGKATLSISSYNCNHSSFAPQVATSISPGSSATLTLRFRPTKTGSAVGTLSIYSNDSDESPYKITVRGYGE
jgi:hypothetical protein